MSVLVVGLGGGVNVFDRVSFEFVHNGCSVLKGTTLTSQLDTHTLVPVTHKTLVPVTH